MDDDLRAGQRRWRATRGVADEERLAAALLRAGDLGGLATLREEALAGRREGGVVRVRLARRRRRTPAAALAALAADVSATPPPPLPAGQATGAAAVESLAELVGRSAAFGEERLPPDEATRQARALLAPFGLRARVLRLDALRLAPDGPHLLQVQREGALLGQGFERGALLLSSARAGLVWVADGAGEDRVDGEPCPLGRLAVRALCLGDPWRTPGIVDVPYQASIPRRFAEALLDRLLDGYARDARHEPDAFPIDPVLRAAGWPGGPTALATPKVARPVLEQFASDLLCGWCGAAEEPLAIVNTVDAFTLRADRLVLRGQARRVVPGARVSPQDV